MNEHLLQTIDSIEETIVESELSVLVSIGNQYAKVALITEYADEDVVNEFDIIQESVIMEAKKDKKTDNNDGKSKEGIIAKLKKAWNFIKGVFVSIGRWFKTKFLNFINKFKKNKQADPQTEKKIKSCEEDVKDISKATSIEDIKEINNRIKHIRAKFGDLKKIKVSKNKSSEKPQDEKKEIDLEEFDKASNKINDALSKYESENKERIDKNHEILNTIKSEMLKAVKELHSYLKTGLANDLQTRMLMDDSIRKEIVDELNEHSSVEIERVKKHVRDTKKTFADAAFIIASANLRIDMEKFHSNLNILNFDGIKRTMDDFKSQRYPFYFPIYGGSSSVADYNNREIDSVIDAIKLDDISFAKTRENAEYEKALNIVQNELVPLVSQVSADMIHYNMTLMKAYEEVAKRHGLT